jgi:hypothetical protein
MEVFDKIRNGKCPQCKLGSPDVYEFRNSDEYLKKQIPRVLKERKKLGLAGLVGGLECVIINTEIEHLSATVKEFLRYTGLDFITAFEDSNYLTCVLQRTSSADFLIRARKEKKNPFLPINRNPKSKHLPNTRLETFVFITKDIEKYFTVQKSRGVRFLTKDIIRNDRYSFIQTIPSSYTGNSIGFIQWHKKPGDYNSGESKILNWKFKKPNRKYLKNIGQLDHAATRVRAQDRDAAIIEFMELTNYNFDFAIYIKKFNSITNVARLSKKDFGMVFTSGISKYISDELSGPTEMFIRNYGTRVHHIAFRTNHIEETFQAIKDNGMEFLIELVGSTKEGLKQTFTLPSKNTLLVTEYIHRYKGFDGFFARSNTTLLTGATAKQLNEI